MNNMHFLQHMADGFMSEMQKHRSQSQLTLGQLIKVLEQAPEGAEVANLHSPHSYRGYYCDLALKSGDGTRPAKDLLADCKRAMGRVFEGYKGGDYLMGETTPLWVAEYGCCGVKLMAVRVGGEIDTAEDEW